MAGCDRQDISETDTENTIKAAFEGNIDEANKHLCDADKLSEADVADIPENAAIENVNCKYDSDRMYCDYEIVVQGQAPVDSTIAFEGW